MRSFLPVFCGGLFVSSSLLLGAGEEAQERLNVLFIAIDDLRPELQCYGVEHIHSPNIDALAAKGMTFTSHYVQAPTCGASRYALLTGRYGLGGNNKELFRRAQKIRKGEELSPSLPAWFREKGYRTVSVGKISHYPGGLGGAQWSDPAQTEMPNSWEHHVMPSGPWANPEGAMHGLAHGEARNKDKSMDVYQAAEGEDNIYPDGRIEEEATRQLQALSRQEDPFFLAVGFIRPHLPFGSPKKYWDLYEGVDFPAVPHPDKPKGRTTWHRSGEFFRYNNWGKNPNEDAEFSLALRRHYAACVSYVDAQVGKLLHNLALTGKAEKTIIVLWGDHGWHLGERAIWGKHSLFEEALRAPLIIVAPETVSPKSVSKSIVETIDLYPTLCDLTGLPIPENLNGESLLPLLKGGTPPQDQFAVSYHTQGRTLRDARYRLILHDDDYCELYDHQSEAGEGENIAQGSGEIVTRLKAKLKAAHQ